MAAEDEPDDDDEYEANAEYVIKIDAVDGPIPAGPQKPVEDFSKFPKQWVKTRKTIEARCKKEKTMPRSLRSVRLKRRR